MSFEVTKPASYERSPSFPLILRLRLGRRLRLDVRDCIGTPARKRDDVVLNAARTGPAFGAADGARLRHLELALHRG